MCSATSAVILPEPPEELKRLSDELTQLVRQRIQQQGPISFSDYMEMVLYQPEYGYYSAGLQKFGAGGDFITSPELGNLFAQCLANQVRQIGAQLESWEIIEAGAGSGVLAADLLSALEDNSPPQRYRILERSAHLRQVQKETLQARVPQWMDRISWLEKPPEMPWQGIFLANEVLDALTVERFSIQNDEIQQLLVNEGPDGLLWHAEPAPQIMQTQVARILANTEGLPADGFCSELNPHLPDWLEAVSKSLEKGLALFIDYGYPRHEYYQPQRRNGTLICHYRHRAHDDPFSWPGLTDISASVDFTALAEAADQCGLDVSGYTSQAMFLLGCGLQSIIEDFQLLPDLQRVRKNTEVRKLTMPGEMGERFQVMALSRNLPEDISEDLIGFSINDLRYRL
jgi:SAM-dependent MidA family methyltransferase